MIKEIKLPVGTQLNFLDAGKPDIVKYKAIVTPQEMFPGFKKGYSAFDVKIVSVKDDTYLDAVQVCENQEQIQSLYPANT